MSSGLSHSDQWTAVLLALLMAFSLPALYGTAAAAGPDPIDDDTPIAEAFPDGSTDNTTTEQSKESTDSTDASVWETADQALADQPGDAGLAREQLALAREVQAISDNSSKSDRAKALDTADTILEQRKGWAASQDKPLPSSQVQRIETQQAKLDAARELLDTAQETKDVDGLARAVKLAKKGTTMQAAQADDSVTMESGLPAVETPGFQSPSAATLELLVRYGIAPTAEDLKTMQRFDDLPEPTRTELTEFLNAYLAFQSATAEEDVTKIFSARNQLLEESQDLSNVLEDGPGLVTPQHNKDLSNQPVDTAGTVDWVNASTGEHGSTVCPHQFACVGPVNATMNMSVYASASAEANSSGNGKEQVGCVEATTPRVKGNLDARFFPENPMFDNTSIENDTETAHFCALQIGDDSDHNGKTGNEPVYDHNSIVLIDTGGNDRYENNAGGTNIDDNCLGPVYLPNSPWDSFTGTNSAIEGDVAAVLVDMGSGDDTYVGQDPEIGCGQRGGGVIGSGFLLDEGGSDTYGVEEATDDPSDKTDDAADIAVNGGASAALNADGCCMYGVATGFLLDASQSTSGGPEDTYNAGRFATNGGANSGLAFATDPRGTFGFLMDTSGSSIYNATAGGTNGGGSGGNGFLADFGSSDDNYEAESMGANGGGNFQAKYGGFLLDDGGRDHYNATSLATNGGAMNRGAGFLMDDGNGQQDNFTAGKTNRSGLRNTPVFALGPNSSQAGLLGVNGGAKEPSVGTLVDVGGPSNYTAGDGQGSNGGGVAQGLGLIVDSGGDDEYIVGNDRMPKAVWNNDEFGLPNQPRVRNPSAGSNGGGAIGGVGSIADSGGNNDYIVTDGHQDGGNLDFSGVNGTNGGAWALGNGGAGFVATSDGADTYKVTVKDGPATGANGGASGFGEVNSLEAQEPTCSTLESDQNTTVNETFFECPRTSGTQAVGTLVDTDSRPDQGEKYIVEATDTGSGPKPEIVGGANGGALGNASVGVLVDREGDDEYKAVSDKDALPNNVKGTLGVNGGAHNPLSSVPGVGLLLDAAGGDTYEQNCNEGNPSNDDTWAPKGNAPEVGGSGAQIDSDEPNVVQNRGPKPAGCQ